MHILKIAAYILVVIGAINWGLIGFFGYDFVSSIFGDMSLITRITYGLVGLSAIVLLLTNMVIFKREEV